MQLHKIRENAVGVKERAIGAYNENRRSHGCRRPRELSLQLTFVLGDRHAELDGFYLAHAPDVPLPIIETRTFHSLLCHLPLPSGEWLPHTA
jgi:hypothetical protein